jgi:glyoxylase-like metal-dependent hydrolase (beta-lactamase superfamily II)
MMDTKFICGILCGAMAVQGFAAEPGLFSVKVGRFEVYMSVENRGQGRPGILLNATESELRTYISGGSYRSETNTFIIRSPEKLLVVDTGFGGAIFDNMKDLGMAPEQVDAVLLTHTHGDHIGGLQRNGKALFPRAELYLARQELDWSRSNQATTTALAPYGARVKTFQPLELGSGAPLFPGLSAIAAFGHTPGHTLYLLESEGQKLLIWGDLMHAEGIQFPLPKVSVSYDTDPAMAAAVRARVLEYAARNRIPVAGMHLNYPAVGMVYKEGGGYRFQPLDEHVQ